MKKLNEKIQNMNERLFSIFQLILAVVLAVAGSFCILCIRSDQDVESLNTLGLAVAVIVCAGIPSLLHMWIDRPLEKLNRMLVVVLLMILAVYTVVTI